jgi:hypothetical protein
MKQRRGAHGGSVSLVAIAAKFGANDAGLLLSVKSNETAKNKSKIR